MGCCFLRRCVYLRPSGHRLLPRNSKNKAKISELHLVNFLETAKSQKTVSKLQLLIQRIAINYNSVLPHCWARVSSSNTSTCTCVRQAIVSPLETQKTKRKLANCRLSTSKKRQKANHKKQFANCSCLYNELQSTIIVFYLNVGLVRPPGIRSSALASVRPRSPA